MTGLRGFVIVSGALASGKTTLAAPLAERLGLPLPAKDIIKESLADQIPGPAGDREWSRTLGGASMELIWALAGVTPGAVLEANFRPHSAYERGRLTALPGPLVEVHCRCPLDLATQRYAARHARGERHPTHVVGAVTLEMQAEFDRPMGLGPVIEVDTMAPVDLDALTARVIEALG
jgi:AAA domain